MTAALSTTEDDALTALRSFIVSVLDPAVEVIVGQDNRVGEPAADDYVVMTPTLRTRLSTNVVSYTDAPGAGTRGSRQATELTVQLDVHGPAASDNAQRLTTLLQDAFGAERFAAGVPGVVPLYAGDPRQMPFVNGEDQYEDRWTIDVALQVNPVVSVPQEFAASVALRPAPADAPGPTAAGSSFPGSPAPAPTTASAASVTPAATP